jgi:hypothetical protein
VNIPPVPIYKKESTLLDTVKMQAEKMEEETVLDDALRNTFPASDPVSIQTIYRPLRNVRPVLTLHPAILVAKPIVKPDDGA